MPANECLKTATENRTPTGGRPTEGIVLYWFGRRIMATTIGALAANVVIVELSLSWSKGLLSSPVVGKLSPIPQTLGAIASSPLG